LISILYPIIIGLDRKTSFGSFTRSNAQRIPQQGMST
jgi:hypothetical protein